MKTLLPSSYLRSFARHFAALATIALAFALVTPIAHAQAVPNADSSTAAPLRGTPQFDCTMAVMQLICALQSPPSAAGLGNRIGTFSVSPNQAGYVWARSCFLATSASNDNRNQSSVAPIAGPNGSGAYLWRISQGNVEDSASMNCHFQGVAGIFSMRAPAAQDNMVTVKISETNTSSTLFRTNCDGSYTTEDIYAVLYANVKIDELTGGQTQQSQFTSSESRFSTFPGTSINTCSE